MSYTRDWSTATGLSPWDAIIGNDYSFNSGLEFHNDFTLIKLSRSDYEAGTTTIDFLIASTTGFPNSRQQFGVSVWKKDGYYFVAELRTYVLSSNLAMWFGFSKINEITGERIHINSQYVSGLTSGLTGKLELWFSAGTWSCRVTYNSVVLGTETYATGDFDPTVGNGNQMVHYGYLSCGTKHITITNGVYSSDITVAPLTRTFWYDGFYNNGNNQGEKDLTANVLSISPIQQYMFLPAFRGIFDARVDVVLKNDSLQWSAFTGFSSSGESYTPPGIFYIRDAHIESAEETLYAGLINYESMQIDALNQTVSFQLHSVLSKLMDLPIIAPNRINRESGDVGDNYGVIRPETLGEVTLIVRDDGEESGTISVESETVLKKNELLSTNITDADDKGLFRVGEYVDYVDGITRFTVEKIPTLLNVGDYLVRNKAYPDELGFAAITGYEFYCNFLKWPAYFYTAGELDAFGGANVDWSIATTAMKEALEGIILSPSKYLYGDETFGSVLDDFLLAVGGGGCASVDGSNMKFFIPSPSFLLQDSQGILDFETDIYDIFTVSKDEPIKSVQINYALDSDERRYLENIRVDCDSGYGINKIISTWLINHDEDARNLAFFISAFFSSGSTLSIQTDAYNWSKTTPGGVTDVTNIPTCFETTGTKFLVLSRVFDPNTKLVTAVLQEITYDVVDFFRVGVHDVNGTAKVL